jgi:nucleotide-binding universal stress UspA family protein
MDWADIAEKTLAQIHRQITATAETYLNSLLTRLQQAEKPSRCLDISIDSVESDEPHRAIIDAAQRLGCDLIMMASHGRRGIGALLLGSQTQKVLMYSNLPVLVWRPHVENKN